ncbi:MAG: NAD+ synthase [Acidimicrobiales bacterium]
MDHLRVAMCQLDTVVGDIAGNAGQVVEAIVAAETRGADLVALPELALTGYPPEDLLLKPAFVLDNLAALRDVAAATGDIVAVVGFVDVLCADQLLARSHGGALRGAPRLLHNAVALCHRGEVIATYRKRLLPNYGVFDEVRWFAPGTGELELYEIAGVRVGVSICEDLWSPEGPVGPLGRAGAQLVVNVNASPYSVGRLDQRREVLAERAAEAGCPIAYVNLVGGQDELVFDGGSMVMGPDGDVVTACGQFAPHLLVFDLDVAPPARSPSLAVRAVSKYSRGANSPRIEPPAPPAPLVAEAEIYGALVLGTRDYLAKNGFTDAVIGLSGGIDSSLVATVAVDALGPGCVHAMAMPSRYSSEGSLTDAQALARALGIDMHVVPIEPAHDVLMEMIGSATGGEVPGMTEENLQSRIRGVLLMAVSNARPGWIVLTTGNKSEMATGYSTLYGDSAGGFAVIKDVPKTIVYALCRWRNAQGETPLVPEAVLTKPPSAELRPDQRDDQSLPPYEVLDPVIEGLVNHDRSIADLVGAGFPVEVVTHVARLVDTAEYKRRQSPPGVRISAKAFGKDRRMPVTNRYRDRLGVERPASVPSGFEHQ